MPLLSTEKVNGRRTTHTTNFTPFADHLQWLHFCFQLERTFAVHQIQCGVVHSSQELVDPCSVLHCWREVQRHFPSLHRTFWTGTFPTANISDRVPFDRWGIYIDQTESIQAVCPLTNPEIQIHTPYLGCVQSEQWIFINFQNIHHAYIALLISMIHLTNIFLFFFFKNLPSCFMIWSCQPTRPIHQWNLKYLKSQVQLPLPETSEVVKTWRCQVSNFNPVPELYDFWCQPGRRR